MKETIRLKKLFKDVYDGIPWLDVNFETVLANIDETIAASRVGPGWNSIWEIVNHIIEWRKTVLKRVHGEIIITPDHNYFYPVENISAESWIVTKKEVKLSQDAWIDFLGKITPEDFDQLYPVNNFTYYDLIHGILQHDVYHLGQISMLSNHLK